MSENKYSLICSTFTGTSNQLHFILFIHLSSHFIFQFLHVVLWSTLACLLACVALKLVYFCQNTHFHVSAAIRDVISFGYRVRLDFWKGVRQTEMVYGNSGSVYVLRYRCTLAGVALKLVTLCQITHFDVLAATIDIITFGYRVGLDFWKGVRQTEIVYANFGGVYVLSFPCILGWVVLKGVVEP